LESEVPVAEEMLDRVVCSSDSFQMCLESGNGSGTFCSWRQRVPDSSSSITNIIVSQAILGLLDIYEPKWR